MSDTSLLRVAGLTQEDEQIYYLVLHRGSTSVSDVVERSAISEREASERLERLRERGFIARAQGSEATYAPVDPRYSLAAVTDALSEQVGRIRAQIPALADQFDRLVSATDGQPEARILSDPADVASWYVRLQHQATREVMTFDRPPYVSSPLEPLEMGTIGRGVRWRSIYTADSFSREGAWEEAMRLAEHGEEARIVPVLPIKLVIVDRSAALFSLSLEPLRSHAMVTEAPPLIDLLCDAFEQHWSRGLPLSASASDPAADSSGAGRGATDEERALLALIGAGLRDEQIADRLGLSLRSLRRRSQKLMQTLGAENRFQAGVEAARRGWV